VVKNAAAALVVAQHLLSVIVVLILTVVALSKAGDEARPNLWPIK
jgi:hypothetical protein